MTGASQVPDEAIRARGRTAGRLPRGPHGLTPEQVAASQRARLLAAVGRTVGERGYGATSVAAVCRAAGVSPRSFYEHFDGKLACFLDAYDDFSADLLDRMGAAVEAEAGWERFIDATLDTYLEALAADPLRARAFLVEGEGAGLEARRLRRAALGRFASLLARRHEQMREADPCLGPLPAEVHLGFAYGVRALVCEQLETGEPPLLTDLAPAVAAWFRAAVRGAE